MFEFRSILFQSDPLLQAIADDALTPDGARVRISSNQHAKDPAVRKVQQALLTWRVDCLPQWGADGEFGSESERAIRRFKIEELQVGPAGIVNDVGPRTVQRLDEIQAAAEASAPPQTPIVVPSVGAGPLVKFTGTPVVDTPRISAPGEDLWARYELVNMGQLATTAQDSVWASAISHGTVLRQAHRNLEEPPIGADGGSHQGTVHIRGTHLIVTGTWALEFAVTNEAGEIVDSMSVPFEVITAVFQG